MKQITFLLLICALSLSNCQSPQQLDILIQHAEVIDVETGKVLSDQQIGIKNGMITSMNNDYSKSFQAKEIIDAKGQFVIPGLWDMHIHFRGGDELILENKDLIPLFVANGITGLREAGGDMTNMIFEWQDKIASGEMVGPKIFTSGPKLDGPNGTWAGSIPVETKEDAIKGVDSLIKMDVDFIKIYDSRISREAYLWIIEEAKKREFRTSGHMPFTVNLEEAVNAGLGSVEHLYYVLKGTSTAEAEVTQDNIDKKASFWGSMDRLMETTSAEKEAATFEMLRVNDTYVTPTLFIGNTLTNIKTTDHSDDEYLNYVGDGIIETYQGRIRSAMRANETFSTMRQNLNQTFIDLAPKLVDAGVSILAGSDCGASNSYVYPGISLHQELQALVASGISEIDALRAATINGARFLKVEDEYGSLKVGKSADLLILSGNPLDDIKNTQNIEQMLLKGQTYTKADMDTMLEMVRKNK